MDVGSPAEEQNGYLVVDGRKGSDLAMAAVEKARPFIDF